MAHRHFYFSALRKADLLLPVLSRSFVFSRACESELTYGEDKRKQIIPILCDPDYLTVLNNPEDFLEEDDDIELRAPKIDSILTQKNRFPANGRFEDDFEANAEQLLGLITRLLEESKKGMGGGHTDHLELPPPWDREPADTPIKKMVSLLQREPSPSDHALVATLKALTASLYKDDVLQEEHCRAAIEVLNHINENDCLQAQPGPALCKLLEHTSDEVKVAAHELPCMIRLCVGGIHRMHQRPMHCWGALWRWHVEIQTSCDRRGWDSAVRYVAVD